MKALTRREIIEAWEKDDRYHDYFVCPDCRDILIFNGDILHCANSACKNTDEFDINGIQINTE